MCIGSYQPLKRAKLLLRNYFIFNAWLVVSSLRLRSKRFRKSLRFMQLTRLWWLNLNSYSCLFVIKLQTIPMLLMWRMWRNLNINIKIARPETVQNIIYHLFFNPQHHPHTNRVILFLINVSETLNHMENYTFNPFLFVRLFGSSPPSICLCVAGFENNN